MERKIVFILSFLLLSGCVTKKKTLSVSEAKTEIKTEQKRQEVTDVKVSAANAFKGFEVNEFAKAVELFNWQYSGNQGEDFSLSINQTTNGYELAVKGKGEASATQSNIIETTARQLAYEDKIDSLYQRTEGLELELSYLQQELKKIKEKEVKVVAPQFGAWIYIIITTIVCLLLFWIERKFKVLNKSQSILKWSKTLFKKFINSKHLFRKSEHLL